MNKLLNNDAERVGTCNDISKNDGGAEALVTESGAECGMAAASAAETVVAESERESRGKRANGCGASVRGKRTKCDTPGTAEMQIENKAVRGFTARGLTYLICAAVSLGFGVFLLCLCAISSASASDALAVILSSATGETDAVAGVIAGAAASLISGAISTIAFGAATVIVGRIAHYLSVKVEESESGVLLLLSKIAKIAAIVLASVVFVIAVLIFIP